MDEVQASPTDHDEDYLDRNEPLDVLYQDFSRQIADLTKLGTSVYRDCWVEFYRWEPGECQQLIVDLPPVSSDTADFEELNDVLPLTSNNVSRKQNLLMDVDSPGSERLITVTAYDGIGSFSHVRVPVEEVMVSTDFEPHPIYESCPPTSKNIARRFHDLNDTEQIPFIPYADEPNFDAEEYAMECESFAWQVIWKDPDRETSSLLHPCRLS